MLRSDFKHPIVFALDVTGSMGDWAKIIYDKLPMLYGQIMTQKYLTDPAISFCAIGDHISDYAPLQVSKFAQGRDIDKSIEKVWLEGGGGPGFTESYELAAYFYLKRVSLVYQDIPFFFVTGDEKYYSKIENETIKTLLGKEPSDFKLTSDMIWEELKLKYNVFYLHKEYDVPRKEAQILEQWTNILGPERILKVSTAKAVVDVILGAIALTSGSRNLDEYVEDMKKRGQEEDRIEEVIEALQPYSARVDILAIRRGRVAGPGEDVKEEEKKIEADGGMENVRDILKPHLERMDSEKDQRAAKLLRLKKHFTDKVPPDFICPITTMIFKDPVMTEDGNTYEREAIEAWLRTRNTSPLTNMHLASKKLIPNITLRKLIDQFIEENDGEVS